MRIVGVILVLFGLVLCFTIIGIFFGIPMILIGITLIGLGGRRKTIIQNVVTVSNAPYAGQPQGLGANLAPQAQLQTAPLQIPEVREQILPPDPGRKEKVTVSTPVDAVQRFTNAFEELTLRASAILDNAKKEGYEVIIENKKITIKRASSSPVFLYSNPEILGFGRSAGLSVPSIEPLAHSPSVDQPAPSLVAGVAADASAASRLGWGLKWNKFIPIGLLIAALLLTVARL